MKISSWFSSLVIIFLILFISIGYSAFTTNLGVEDIAAHLRVSADIRITSISTLRVENDAMTQYEDYGVNTIMSEIVLPNEDSSVTYNVDVTNFGGEKMVIAAVNNLPDNLEYSIDNYELNHIICDDSGECGLGITKTLIFKIKYKSSGYKEEKTKYNIKLDFDFSECSYKIVFNRISLPDEFQELDYIESTGTQRINTEYIPKTNTKMELTLSFSGDFKTSGSGVTHFVESYDSGDIFQFNFGDLAHQNNTIFAWFDKSLDNGGVINSFERTDKIRTNKNTITYEDGKVTYGDLEAQAAKKTKNHSTPVYLFGNASKAFDRYNMKVYGLKFYEAGSLKREYVPCYRKSDGVAGLYDIISGKFYTNAGTGSFKKGSLVERKAIDIQQFKYGEVGYLKKTYLHKNDFINSWNTEMDGSGIKYREGQEIFNLSDVNGQEINLYAQWELPFSGAGSSDEPYLLGSIEDWVYLSNLVNNHGLTFANSYFKMTRDLDFNGVDSYIDASRIDFGDVNGDGKVSALKEELTTGLGFSPIGYVSAFAGYFDGGEKTLDNLYIYNSNTSSDSKKLTGVLSDSYIALFSKVSNGWIKNFTVSGNTSSVIENNMGGVVGLLDNGVVDNVVNKVNVVYRATNSTRNYNIGGIVSVPHQTSKIMNSGNFGEISSLDNTASNRTYLGGVVATFYDNLIISNCHNSGKISNGWRSGGIIASVALPDSVLVIDRCFNTGNITGLTKADAGHSHTGGIIGLLWNPSSATSAKVYMTNCYNTGAITNNFVRDASGLIGDIASYSKAYVFNSYNVGTITGNVSETNAAGIAVVGSSYNTKFVTNNVFNYGNVSGKKYSHGIGAIYNTDYQVTNTYYKNNVSASNVSIGTAMAAADFNKQDFVNKLNTNVNNINLDSYNIPLDNLYKSTLCKWKLGPNGYPILDF